MNDVLELEKRLHFEMFSNHDAWVIGNKILSIVEKKKLKPVRIRIVYEGDIVFQYIMPGKKGVEWLDRKQNTVERYKHSSYYVFLDQQENHLYDEEDTHLAICGGGFPLVVNDKLCGCIIVSGLRHDEDHQLIIDALEDYFDESSCE